ncbi:Nuclear factor 7, ovary [Bagarius yarrelli]|uniref:Nuclear factor 7, ovary n=1 Tax=Bagarius yarrelli TaxID=175774 RepID=A0A556V8W3_BAGYA|nr:Nuclear factor 7, ovary [Bagarius yarrelli]
MMMMMMKKSGVILQKEGPLVRLSEATPCLSCASSRLGRKPWCKVTSSPCDSNFLFCVSAATPPFLLFLNAQKSFPKPAERSKLVPSLQTRVPEVTPRRCQYDRSVQGVNMSSKLPEEDLSCPVCCEIFSDPVLLPCSHSFCRSCLQNFWDSSVFRSCPVCRRRASRKTPPSNLALRNLCESFVQTQSWSCEQEKKAACPQHGEKKKLFCMDDQQPICIVCQASRMHKGHECAPTEEAALDCKVLLGQRRFVLHCSVAALCLAATGFGVAALENAVNQVGSDTISASSGGPARAEAFQQHLTSEKLDSALKALKAELDLVTKLQITSAMTLDHIRNQAQLTETRMKHQFTKLHQFLREEEEARLSALKHEETKKVQDVKRRDEELTNRMSSLTDVISRTEQEMAADDLTLLQPINPERFCVSAEVLGSTAICSGTHVWDVELGESDDWILGVASISVKRDLEVPARPENGFWTLCMRDGEYRAMASPVRTLKIDKKLERVRVAVDWDAGDVCFSCPVDGKLLYKFTQTFTDKVVPYFYTQSKKPLKVVPQLVVISVKN